jgi:hypothetical protein
VITRCAQCGHAGPPELFEPFNLAGNLACKATVACQYRQNDRDPVTHLGALLRAVRPELGTLSTGQLASLAADLNGYRQQVLDELLLRPGGKDQLNAETRDRAERQAGR